MPRFEVLIEGMALWVDRGVYWDVLFPKCVEDSRQMHEPRLRVQVAGWEVQPPMRLKGTMLDLLHLTPGYARPMSMDWMLPIRRDPAKAPSHPAPRPSSKWVVASLRLPKRELVPVSRTPVGPVRFDGRTDHFLDFGTLWHTELFSSQAFVVFRSRKSQLEKHTLPIDGFGTTIRLVVQNRTAAEHDGDIPPTQPGELLSEVQDLLSLAGSSQELPSYVGELPVGPSHRVSPVERAGLAVDPYRLCPQGYCEDCPGD